MAQRRLDLPTCLRIGVSLASRFAHLHTHKAIHGAVRPTNIRTAGESEGSEDGLAEFIPAPSAPVPVPPAELVPEIARIVSNIAMKLLAKRAEDRHA